ncbi:MAG: cupin domain-containing protein [Yoonia sp.]|uniref:cupin domain-containing protein n=1 Tax=Yoonia sp. TaxID=2212373 RepID=UPI003EF1AA86
MHHVAFSKDIQAKPMYGANAQGFRRASIVDRTVGAVHTSFSRCVLDAGGHVDRHVHSFEEFFYVVEGNPVLVCNGQAVRMVPGAAGVIPVGVEHCWLGADQGAAAWIELQTPIPRGPEEAPDTFFIGPVGAQEITELDIRDPRSRHLFMMADDDIKVDNLKLGSRVDAPKVSASMATALLAYSGIAVKMLVDERLSAALGNMFMVEYQPGGVAHLHDHPLEEAYYMLEGEVEFVADGQSYTVGAGDVMWAGVGCVHAFYNTSGKTVRWLETQAPLPPARHSYRFERDWEYLTEKLAE